MDKAQLRKRVEDHLLTSAEVKRACASACVDSVTNAARVIAASFASGGKLLLCGNGGSAADCQHMAAEFVSRLTVAFPRPALPALALTTDTSFLTAYANDINWETIFGRQVEALGRTGDTLLGISTSGNSANVIHAVNAAKQKGMKTVVLTGRTGKLAALADVAVSVPGDTTQHIQESHLALEHIICDLVERSLYDPTWKGVL